MEPEIGGIVAPIVEGDIDLALFIDRNPREELVLAVALRVIVDSTREAAWPSFSAVLGALEEDIAVAEAVVGIDDVEMAKIRAELVLAGIHAREAVDPERRLRVLDRVAELADQGRSVGNAAAAPDRTERELHDAALHDDVVTKRGSAVRRAVEKDPVIVEVHPGHIDPFAVRPLRIREWDGCDDGALIPCVFRVVDEYVARRGWRIEGCRPVVGPSETDIVGARVHPGDINLSSQCADGDELLVVRAGATGTGHELRRSSECLAAVCGLEHEDRRVLQAEGRRSQLEIETGEIGIPRAVESDRRIAAPGVAGLRREEAA